MVILKVLFQFYKHGELLYLSKGDKSSTPIDPQLSVIESNLNVFAGHRNTLSFKSRATEGCYQSAHSLAFTCNCVVEKVIADCEGSTYSFVKRRTYRLQLSQNIWDSLGFLVVVLGPRKYCYSPIVCLGSRLGSCISWPFFTAVDQIEAYHAENCQLLFGSCSQLVLYIQSVTANNIITGHAQSL